MAERHSKIFAGSRIRELRGRIRKTQQDLAKELGLSPSYLNQIENDQRPIPSPLMLKLCNLFDVSPAYFGDSDEIRQIQALREILGDPLFKSASLRPTELQGAVRAAPALADRFVTLYRAYRTIVRERNGSENPLQNKPFAGRDLSGSQLDTSGTPVMAEPVTTVSPYEAVGDWVQRERNYFDEIDRAAEDLYETLDFSEGLLAANLERYLRDHHGVKTLTDSSLDSRSVIWRFDKRGRRLLMADGVPSESSVFCMAQVVGRLGYGRLLDRAVKRSGLTSPDARDLAHVGMSNYFAGALLLPYTRFRQSARTKSHDLDQLQRQFGVSFEQVCHRLSTLQRPGHEGLPFYFIKTDIAGNILKSYSATRFNLPRFGGLCSLWNVFRAFATPGELQVQVSRTTDDAVFLNVARTVGHAGTSYFDRPRRVAIVLGCSVSHASELVYAAGLDLSDERTIIPIGPGCRACIRTDCRHRAIPAAGFQIDAGGEERGVVPYHMVAQSGE
ncbi:helix-turn-helix domain-containing protein [Acetobacter sp.]|uniref:helix-turn-helix domain-containing protein n=1 Tax=Acetobacter sp. TaxID=440 RepID=UPI0025C0544A|nr:helix-turn-helix transcriptional regulator [Acetobacter sp.]MCH4090633.1 short-chain fatty acyl-CoA regulator family protein [Acetobacter sp.]MCI1300076.1 short-chain fatty acyl-CoA regulator family protein [Acetobacter sp.]MCI1316494.1 short-chain fatty acyl-CoA regulator family protein [Acetobacter sp.]